MLKIFKNLKKSFVMIIVIILLLIVQAMADLRLPEYTSKTVNTGIQSSGIENVAPEVISESPVITPLPPEQANASLDIEAL